MTVTYIVGYVDDLILADRSNQNHFSKQIMECIQKYWKVGDERTLRHVLGQYMTRPTEKLVKEAYRVMGYLEGTSTSDTKHWYTLNYETGLMLCVMQVLQMTDLQGNVNKDT